MTLFKAPFQPALNKDGYAKLTFVGLEVKTGKTKETGRDYQLNNLKFECMGRVRGTSTFINVSSGQTFNIDSDFCKALLNMGLKPVILKEIYEQIYAIGDTKEDEDGFEVEDTQEDEDGFSITDEFEIDFSEIEKFCVLNSEKTFIAKVGLNDKKYWEIEASTIKPLVKATEAKPKEKKSTKKGKTKPVETIETTEVLEDE